MAQLSHKYGGTYTTLGAYLFKAPAPLDTRSVVETIGHLISQDVWKNSDYTAFNGLQVYVESTQELYILKDSEGLESDLQQESYFTGTTNKEGEVITPPATSDAIQTKVDLYWLKLASASDLSGLSGVFKFKGVAEAINLDQSILTIKSLVTQEIKDENEKVTTPSETLYCVTSAYEFDMDVYYGWGTSLDDIRFWTDTTTVTSGTSLYDKGEQLLVTAYEFNNKLYYPTETKDKYESVDGDVVYIKENKAYQTSDFQTILGNAKVVSYDGYDFKEKSLKLLLEADADSESISASSDNSGHVYQIGENEYASNGQIWVKLGSPVEDWIIL